MGRKTRELNAAKRAKINELLEWAKGQQAAFAAVAHFSAGTTLYAELPHLPPGTGGGFERLSTKRMVLVPNAVDEQVTIPAGFRRVFGDHIGPTKFMACVTTTDADDDGMHERVYVELALGLEILLPGGESAFLVQRDGLVTVLDHSPDVEEALAAAKKPDPAKGISLQDEPDASVDPGEAPPEVPPAPAAPAGDQS